MLNMLRHAVLKVSVCKVELDSQIRDIERTVASSVSHSRCEYSSVVLLSFLPCNFLGCRCMSNKTAKVTVTNCYTTYMNSYLHGQRVILMHH